MNSFEQEIESTFDKTMLAFSETAAMKRVSAKRLTIDEYASILREVYFYTREDPQIQALATVYFRGRDRGMVKNFLRHAIAEIGHDQLALNDLSALGYSVENIPYSAPLPTTISLISYPFYQINYRNPIGYLGYLYFLEHMPTRAGSSYANALKAIGVPDNALSFLMEHTHVDVAHNQLMKSYISTLVSTEADCTAVCYGMRVTGRLYADMLNGAIENCNSSPDSTSCFEELSRGIVPDRS